MHAAEQAWILEDRGDRFDRTIEWLLIALLTFMPLAFGAVAAWSEEIVIGLAAVICVVFALKVVLSQRALLVWTWAYVPLLIFILVALVQVVTLPVAWVRLISPQTVLLKTQLLGEISGLETTISNIQISFYPHATWHDLRLVLAGAAVFTVVANVFRRSEQILRLLWAIAIIGAGIAILALAQTAFGNGRIYWFVGSPHRAFSGPFVNHSHYAQFMNLSIGAALAVIFATLHRRFGGRSVTAERIARYFGAGEGKRVAVLLLIVALGAASVFVSLSRGGMISMMIAGVFTALVVSSRASLKGSGWIMALLALGAFACVLYVGFDAVYDRLGTLQDLSGAQAGRWQIVKDIAVAWTRFPVMGTGLGTHEVVYPMFDRSTTPALATHAENEYAQAAEETGVAGLVALIAFGTIVWSSYVRAVRTPRAPIHSAAYGLGFGLLAITIHSLSDFGQHLPANAFLSAIFCALLIRLPRVGLDTGAVADGIPAAGEFARRCGRGGIVLVVACVMFGAALFDADAARRAETCWAKVRRAERDMMKANWQAGDEEYVYLLNEARTAQQYQPSNVQYRYWLDVYRWHAISRVNDPNTPEVILSPQAREFADRIVEDLKQAVTLCPVFGPAWSVLGQLEYSVCGRRDEGVRHVLKGHQLAPCDPTTCLVAGTLYAERSDVEAAFLAWQRAVELDGRMFAEVSSSLVMLGRADLACKLAGDDANRLIRVEQTLRESGGDAGLVTEISDQIWRIFERECQEAGAPAWKFAWLAQKYRGDGRMDEAVQMYRRALALEYGQVSWRFHMAQMLADQGLVSAATDELRTCLRLRPQFDAALRLLESLSVRASTGKNPGPR